MLNIQPAQRLEEVKEYYFSKKLKEIGKLNKQGYDIINLGIGSPDLPPIQGAIDTLCNEAQKDNNHGYQPYTGIPELREEFARWYGKWYGVNLNKDTEILPLIGSKEGILHITLAFVNPGEQVLVPNPGYPTYTSLSKLLGADVVNYDLNEKNNWAPDFDSIEKLDLSKVKLMWVNYPNMPTGTNSNRELFIQLINFAKKHNIIVVNDNPYSFILNKDPLSILNIPEAKEYCIELNSMSKSHNVSGWRIGMIAANSKFISWILKVKSNIDSGMFKPLQLAAAEALKSGNEWYDGNNLNYQRRKKLAILILKELSCSFNTDQVGLFLWGKIPNTYSNVEQFADKILKEAKVFITPGTIFGSNGRRYIRLSLCCSEERLKVALERIRHINQQTN